MIMILYIYKSCVNCERFLYFTVIMVVFDLGNLMSLAHCQQWLHEASLSNIGSYHIFLVGTKKDLLVSTKLN